MTRDGLLLVHVGLGTAGLLLGPAVLVTRGAVRAVAARGYLVAVGGVVVTAVGLVALDPAGLWWLLPVAGATAATTVLGVRSWSSRPAGWPTACAHLLGGSYIALVTGAFVGGTGNPLFWVLPAVVGQWPVAVAKRRLAALPPATAVAGPLPVVVPGPSGSCSGRHGSARCPEEVVR